MKHMTILVDMDDTLENLLSNWVDFINVKHGTSVRVSDIYDWDISKAFPCIAKDEIFAPLFERSLWQRVKPLPGAVKYLKKLIDDGHKIIIVTASHYKTIDMKLEEVLFKYFPFISEKDIIITYNKQLISGDILIDDAPHNLEGGTYRGILFTAPHNRLYDAESNGFFRADNWADVYACIQKMI